MVLTNEDIQKIGELLEPITFRMGKVEERIGKVEENIV